MSESPLHRTWLWTVHTTDEAATFLRWRAGGRRDLGAASGLDIDKHGVQEGSGEIVGVGGGEL